MLLRKHWQPLLLTLLALATIPATLLYTEQAISNIPEPEQKPAEVNIPRVTTMAIQAGSWQSEVQVFGEVQAVDQIDLSSQVAGRVIWRNPAFADGGRVAKGDDLIHIDATDYRAALASVEQALAQAQLELQQEQRQQRQARRDWQRAGLKEKPGALVLREPQLRVAQARFDAAKAALQQARRDLAQTKLAAPFDAVVVKRQVATGSYLDAGTVVATLQSSERAEIRLALSASQWQQLPAQLKGLPVMLSSQAQPDVQWHGVVVRLSAAVDAATRLRTLVVAVDKPLDQPTPLLFGTFVSAQLEGEVVNDLFAIPASALTADGQLWYLEAGRLQQAARTPLFSRQGQLYVARGDLPAELQLVRKALSSYLPGMQVRTVSAVDGDSE